MPPKLLLVVGDKWPMVTTPGAKKTTVKIDISKTLKELAPEMASQLDCEESYIMEECTVAGTVEKKPGPPIKPDEVLSEAHVTNMLFIKKKGATPAAGAKKLPPKPGAKPPPPGAKPAPPKPGTPAAAEKKEGDSSAPPSPTAASATGKATSPTAKKFPPKPGTGAAAAGKKGPPPPKPGTATPKPATATPKAETESEDSSSSSSENKKPEAGEETIEIGATSFNKPAAPDSDSDADGAGSGKESASAAASAASGGGGGGGESETESDSEKKPAPAAATKPAVTAKPKVTPKAKPTPAPPTTTRTPPSESDANAVAVGASVLPPASMNIAQAAGGSSQGYESVASALAAQRAVDERLVQLQKTLVEEEKKRVEQYENNLRHALASEVDQIKQQLNASMQEERARSMQVQAVLEDQRTHLLKALAERDGQLQMAQGALHEAAALGATKATPTLDAMSRTGSGTSSTSQLAAEMKNQNEKLKTLLDSKDSAAASRNNSTRADLDQMVRAQSQLVQSVGNLQQSMQPPSNTVQAEKKNLSSFLGSVGLSRFIDVLEKQDIDMELLSVMSDEELSKAGVDTVGARKRILLEFSRNRSSSNNNNNNSPGGATSRGLNFGGGGGAGGEAGSPKKGVSWGENQIHPPPGWQTGAPGSVQQQQQQQTQNTPKMSQQQQQAVELAQQQADAAALPPKLQDHHRVLHLLFRRAGAHDWLARTAEMVNSFKESLPALYEAVCGKLGVPEANFAEGTGANALKAFINRRFPHLIPSINVIAFLADGREAEFADTMILRQLKMQPQRLVWFSVPVDGTKAPDNAEDDGANGKLYFYSALSKLSQWKRPTILENRSVPKVVLPSKPLDDALPSPGEKLPTNPKSNIVQSHRATDQQYVAATVSLLMRKDPPKLSQFPEFLKAYERPVVGSGDTKGEGKINYKGMYLDALQAYGPDDD